MIKEIRQILLGIQQVGATLDVHQIHGVIIAQIQYTNPNIFKTVVNRDNSMFVASTKWVWKFLTEEMNWTLQCATCASQKIPADADHQLHASLLHHAYSVHNFSIPCNL